MERNHRVGYIITSFMFMLFSLSIVLIANGNAYAASQYSLTCASCHGMPPLDSASLLREVDTGAFKGSHQTHQPATAQAVNCTICHNNSGYTTSHRDGKIQFTTRINNYSSASGGYVKGASPITFTNQTSVPVLGSCSNVNCHFLSPTPLWGTDKAATNCTTCHGVAPSDGSHPTRTVAASGRKHFDYYSSSTILNSCVKCHPNNTTFSHATSVKGGLKVQFVTAPNTTGNYSGDITYPNNLTNANRNGSCSNTYCHSNGRTASVNVTPTWGGSLPVNCTGCHGGDRNSAAFQIMSTGRHTKHITGQYNYGCAECHAATADSNTSILDKSKHVNKNVDVSIIPKWGTSLSYPSIRTTGDTTGTCQNVYCHSNAQIGGQGGTAQVFRNMTGTKTWFSAGTLGCTNCHGTGVVTGAGALSGKHLAHLNTTVNTSIGTALSCNDCHLNGGTNLNRANHVNKFINYSGLKAGSLVLATGVCSTVYCHSDGKGTLKSMSADNWFSARTLDCKGCHGSDAAPAFTSVAGEPNYASTGSNQPGSNTHQKHVKSLGASTCVNCHSTTTTNGTSIVVGSTTHADGTITLAAGNGKSFTWSANKTCNTISCHNNGAATWGGTLLCSNCHSLATMSGAHLKHAGGLDLSTGVTFYNYTANTSSGTGNYSFGCANCHPSANTLTHANGNIDVELTGNASGAGSIRTKNSAAAMYNKATTLTCDNVYCHSDGSSAPGLGNIAWTGTFSGLSCDKCHGNSPSTGAHSAHVVGIHYDDIFNGTSGKLPAGSTGNVSHGIATQASTINCDICHSNTVTSSANDQNTVCKTCHGVSASLRGNGSIGNISYHVNGKVDVAFKNVKVVSKAQLRPGTFVNYTGTWERNSSNYKNGSSAYDTAKIALNDSMWASGIKGQGTCTNISCHVGNTVKWNDTLTCESCHTKL